MRYVLLASWLVLWLSLAAHAQPSKVEIVQDAKAWCLHVNGHPFFIKGAGDGAAEHIDQRALRY